MKPEIPESGKRVLIMESGFWMSWKMEVSIFWFTVI